VSLQKNKKLNNLHGLLPEGVAVPSQWLLEQGYSRQLVRKYVQSNWLVPLGRGVYARPQSTVNWQGLVLGMQLFAKLPFHLGGVSSLNIQGYSHYLPLGGEQHILLWGRSRVPAWVKAVSLPEQLRFKTVQLFDDTVSHVGMSSVPSAVRDLSITVSSPERAIMEVLYGVDDEHNFNHAVELFEGLTALRPKVVNELLQHCQSVKVKRLFLWMMGRFSYSWIRRINAEQVALGSGKRMVVKGGKLNNKYLITIPSSFDD